MQPEFEDETPINPFDFWQGANFKIKIKKVAGYWNYDSSEFSAPEALLGGDDDALEALWKQEFSLAEIVAPDQFKSYEDLKKRLDYVLGIAGTPKRQDPEVMDEEVTYEPPAREPVAVAADAPSSVNTDDDEEDALSYFAKLAES